MLHCENNCNLYYNDVKSVRFQHIHIYNVNKIDATNYVQNKIYFKNFDNLKLKIENVCRFKIS